MEWIKIENESEIPADYFINRKRILVELEDGLMAVVYWDGYGWNIDGTWNEEQDDIRIHGKIKKYIALD